MLQKSEWSYMDWLNIHSHICMNSMSPATSCMQKALRIHNMYKESAQLTNKEFYIFQSKVEAFIFLTKLAKMSFYKTGIMPIWFLNIYFKSILVLSVYLIVVKNIDVYLCTWHNSCCGKWLKQKYTLLIIIILINLTFLLLWHFF